MCGYFELSKNLIGWVISKIQDVYAVDTLFTTEKHFSWEKDKQNGEKATLF